MQTYTEKQKETFTALGETFGYTNVMQTPRVQKVVVSTGTGKKSRMDRHANDFIRDRLAELTGQKPGLRRARKSIAGFKIREGDPIGHVVTLRGKRAATFIDKLVHVVLPRTKDFRGIKLSAVDQMGNITIGIKDHSVFPEASEEELRNIFGLSITVVTSATTKEEATAYLRHLGFPLQKEEA